MQYFATDFSEMAVGDVSLTAPLIAEGFSELENSGTPANVTILTRASVPAGLKADSRFPSNPAKQVLRFTLPATDVEARLLWSGFPAGVRTVSVAWWEYRDAGNLGGEKFCRVGNFISAPGSNRGVDSIITLGQVSGTTLIANSANMHDYGDHALTPGITGFPGLYFFEALYSLSTGTNADGSVSLYRNGSLIGQAMNLQFFDTTGQAATGIQLWDMGGWSSTSGGTEGVVTYPIVRYLCEARISSTYQGPWVMGGGSMGLVSRSLHENLNQDQSWDSRYPDGSKPFIQPASLGVNLTAFRAAGFLLTGQKQGTAVDFNYRQFLTGTSASSAVLSVNATSGTLGSWVIDASGNGISNDGSILGNGTLQVTATDGVTPVSFDIQSWSCTAVASGQKKKWRPGHAGGFNTIISGTGGIPAQVKAEINAIAPYPNVLGYLASVCWGALEPTPGESDTSATYPNGYATGATLIRSLYDLLANMSPPRDLCLKLQLGAFTSTHPGINDFSIIPQYVQTNSIYGQAGYKVAGSVTTVAGRYGWWGGDGNGNTYGAQIGNANVMNRIIQMTKVFGGYFDKLPLFYCWNSDENSFIIGTSSANGNPAFNATSWDTQYRNYVSQCIGSWPTTHFMFENSYGYNPNLTQAFTDFLMQQGAVQGNTDVLGLTYSNAHSGSPYTWGMAMYCGFPSGATGTVTNYRDKGYALMTEVQATDMGAYGQFGGGYTKEDILAEINQVLKASRVWWSILTGASSSYGNIKPNSTWVDMGPFLNNPANALLNTTYPSIVPGYT